MNKIAIFTLLAEKNKEKYIQRLSKWYNQFQNNQFLKENADFFIGVDGELTQQDFLDNNLFSKFIIYNNVPYLGVKFGTMFWPGWKRSFRNMLEKLSNYNKILFVESDTKIINFTKIIKYLNIEGFTFASIINNDLHFSMETCLMILNNKETRNILINAYYNDKFLLNDSGLDIEGQLTYILKPNIVLSSKRISYDEFPENFNIDNYDFIGNYWHNNINKD